ncbi:hypothetical protein ACJ73_09791, partial [Blastomyces percursus]
MLKKCRYYLYGVHFILETDAKTLVAQLNRSATDLPAGALVTGWLAWIRMLDFEVRHIDGLSRRPPAEGEVPEDQNIDEFIDAELNYISGMVERGHRPISDALSKLAADGRNWANQFHSALWADLVTIRQSTGETHSACNITWQTVQSRADLVYMRIRQLEKRDEDLEEAAYHLRREREKNRDLFDETKRLVREPLQIGDLVLLHDTKIEKSYSVKLNFRWLGPCRIREANHERGTYRLEELDRSPFRNTTAGNRLKIFLLRDSELHAVDDIIDEEEVDVQESGEKNSLRG